VALLDGHRAERLPEVGELFVTPLAEGWGFRYVDGLERLVDERPIRVFLPTGPERHGAVRRLVVSRFAGRASIVWSDLTGVEILAPGTHKGEAVSWLASTRGISPAEVAAVGDAANDAGDAARGGLVGGDGIGAAGRGAPARHRRPRRRAISACSTRSPGSSRTWPATSLLAPATDPRSCH